MMPSMSDAHDDGEDDDLGPEAPGEIDAEYRRAAAALPPDRGDWLVDPPERLRAAYDACRAALAGDEAPGVAITPSAEGLRFTPPGAPLPGGKRIAILYFHGGGFVVGSPETHRVAVSHLSARTRLPVLSCRYRRAPEHPFPAQAEDAARHCAAALAGETALGALDAILIAGDSAGAAMAFWAEGRLEPALRARVGGIVGFYGAFGETASRSIETYGAREGMSAAVIDAVYARLGATDDEIRVARHAEPIAPVYLAAAGCDPFRDDSLHLAERLSAAGRACALDLAPTLPHAWLHMAGRVPAASAALDRAAAWIVRAAATA